MFARACNRHPRSGVAALPPAGLRPLPVSISYLDAWPLPCRHLVQSSLGASPIRHPAAPVGGWSRGGLPPAHVGWVLRRGVYVPCLASPNRSHLAPSLTVPSRLSYPRTRLVPASLHSLHQLSSVRDQSGHPQSQAWDGWSWGGRLWGCQGAISVVGWYVVRPGGSWVEPGVSAGIRLVIGGLSALHIQYTMETPCLSSTSDKV